MTATRILGIDPGLNRTGWGVIEIEGNRLRHIAHGVATSSPAEALAHRLSLLYAELAKLIVVWSPAEAAVEEVFVNANPSSTLKLGMARGVALLAPAIAGLPVAEYAANLVKKSIVGSGHADKTQIAMMIRVLLPGVTATADAADALAVAICHAHHRTTPHPGVERPDGPFRPKPDAVQITRARRLRTDGTEVERLLWNALRNGQLGVKFRRQVPVQGYFADFLSHEAKLIVELDGGQHAGSPYDARRTTVLEQAGFRVLRFWNNEVNESLDGVLQLIAAAIKSPRPIGEREGPAQREGEGVLPQPDSQPQRPGPTPSPGTAKPAPTSPRRGEVKRRGEVNP